MTAESSAAFFRDIAKKRMGAGALLFDEAGSAPHREADLQAALGDPGRHRGA